jgi:hypothetical protein
MYLAAMKDLINLVLKPCFVKHLMRPDSCSIQPICRELDNLVPFTPDLKSSQEKIV